MKSLPSLNQLKYLNDILGEEYQFLQLCKSGKLQVVLSPDSGAKLEKHSVKIVLLIITQSMDSLSSKFGDVLRKTLLYIFYKKLPLCLRQRLPL